MSRKSILVFVVCMCCFSLVAQAEDWAKTQEPNGASKAELERIAKMSANPLGALWMLWLQHDTKELDGGVFGSGKFSLSSTKFQPVMTFQFEHDSDEYNFIFRPVIQYNSTPIDSDAGKLFGLSSSAIQNDPRLAGLAKNPTGRTEGFGDTALLTLVGPNRLDGNIWGVGMTQIVPTAEEDVLGQGKWQAGPAFLWAHLAKDVGGFNYGALAQHWWSYAGDDDRADTSFTDVQYFLNYRLSATELVGMTPNIQYDWKAESENALTVPIGLGYSNVVKFGKLPVRILTEIQYNVIRPDDGGSDWNLRFIFAPIIPNPMNN